MFTHALHGHCRNLFMIRTAWDYFSSEVDLKSFTYWNSFNNLLLHRLPLIARDQDRLDLKKDSICKLAFLKLSKHLGSFIVVPLLLPEECENWLCQGPKKTSGNCEPPLGANLGGKAVASLPTLPFSPTPLPFTLSATAILSIARA